MRGDIGDAIWPEWRRRAEDEWKRAHSTAPQEEGMSEELSHCHKVATYYNPEHDNFYCTVCYVGQGQGYYERNIGSSPHSS